MSTSNSLQTFFLSLIKYVVSFDFAFRPEKSITRYATFNNTKYFEGQCDY